MPSERLHQLLQQLHQEVDSLGESDPQEKTRLEQLINEIESVLDNTEIERQASMLDNMRAKLAELEADHPTATGVVQRLMQTLSDMGI